MSFFYLAKIKGAPINECHKMSDFKRKKVRMTSSEREKNEGHTNENEKMKKNEMWKSPLI